MIIGMRWSMQTKKREKKTVYSNATGEGKRLCACMVSKSVFMCLCYCLKRRLCHWKERLCGV